LLLLHRIKRRANAKKTQIIAAVTVDMDIGGVITNSAIAIFIATGHGRKI
jgi:hypothetical protein